MKNWNSFTHTYFTYRYIVRNVGKQDVRIKDLESIDPSEIKTNRTYRTTKIRKTVIIRIFFKIKKLFAEFIDLLNQIESLGIVDENKALSSGAFVSY